MPLLQTNDLHRSLVQIVCPWTQSYWTSFPNLRACRLTTAYIESLHLPTYGAGMQLSKMLFRTFKDAVTSFGVDWLGRIFALDSRRRVSGRPGVTLFEPGTGQALEVPCNIESFHDEELVDYKDAALAEAFFNEWILKGGRGPSYSQCVGYKRPLFLGGVDAVENLELTDLDVYWTISAQLISKLRNVPLVQG
jgi:hypothetical protein